MTIRKTAALCAAASFVLWVGTALGAQTPAATGAKAPAKTAAKAKKSEVKATPAATAPTEKEVADAKAKGLVWVNLNSGVYHKGGDFYGKTKSGKFMTEDEAKKAGHREAKEPGKKKTEAPATVPPPTKKK